MPEPRRDRPHIYVRDHGSAESYTNPNRPPRRQLPQRDRSEHAAKLREELRESLAAATKLRAQAGVDAGGVYLDFTLPKGSDAAEKLEAHKIELMAVRERQQDLVATVFVPKTAESQLAKKIDQYETENTTPRTREGKPPSQPRPKHEALIASVDAITHSQVKSIFTGAPEDYPMAHEKIWWELWLRAGSEDDIGRKIADAGLVEGDGEIEFPARCVRLVYGDTESLGRLFVNSTALAEIRRRQDSPAVLLGWNNTEQAAWAKDAASRLNIANASHVAVTILDTGVNRGHPMLAPLIAASDVAKHEPSWLDGDSSGHGTEMAGVALYGDLFPVLMSSGPIEASHCVESVKIFPDKGLPDNKQSLYGAITKESVARAQIAAPIRRRAICMAVTSDYQAHRGRPSSWSAAVDQICSGENGEAQLMLISAGNVRDFKPGDYPDRNELESVESPAQAWNALTVGAITEKVDLTEPDYAGWLPVAPAGELGPTSRTSVLWERQWPLKPEILMEGGNLATCEEKVEMPDELGILTTDRYQMNRQFTITGETSAATALASHLAAKVIAKVPERWPETIRGLLVHSAEWTPAMQKKLEAASKEQPRLLFLRRYGYGVPGLERALLSATNDLTLVLEEKIRPFKKEGGRTRTNHMKVHALPWPIELLGEHMEAEVELKVTLSYFVEPNPGERGWLRKHRYASHGFRFDLKRPTETKKAFRARISRQAESEDELTTKVPGDDGWSLGRIRNVGSIHSDSWRGTAAELAQRDLLAVYPTAGWWKENPGYQRYDRECRYSLIVSLRVPAAVDIYTPIATTLLGVATEVET